MRSWTAVSVALIVALLLSLVTFAAPAAAQSIPQLALWEAHMTSYGQQHCDYLAQSHTFDEKLNATYYDAIRVFYQIADYTKNSAWNTCAQRARTIYRDQYVMTAACWGGGFGCVPGYWNFTHGERMDYERTGDTKSRDSVLSQALNAAYSTDSDYNAAETQTAWLSREEAYALTAHINAERLGAAPRASTPKIADKNLAYIDQWFGSKSFRCPSICDPAAAAGQYYIQPFMVGLTAEALIMWFDKTGDTRVVPAIKMAMDWLWANAWVAGDQSFWYENWVPTPATPFPARPGAPDLNLLIAPAFAWLYAQTGDTTYRDRGDQIFAGGVVNAFLGNGKQFDQNYKWSFEYVRLRTAGTTPPPPVPSVDTTPPAVSVTAPAAGATVSGTVSVTATASDNVGVAGVQFMLDGNTLGAEVTVAPYKVSWNTTSVTPGAHTLTAVARDAAGNRTTSAAVAVTAVSPPTVSITAPTTGATVASTVAVTANASDAVGVAGVQFKMDGTNLGAEVTAAPYSMTWTTTGTTNGAHSLTAVARNTAGVRTTSAAVSVTVSNDKTAPTVSIVAPAAGGTVIGTVSVTANATDNVGVAGVQFKVDGVNVGVEVTRTPYTVSWSTATTANGSHTLTAVARDAAGNRATSAAVTVSVANATSVPPTPTPVTGGLIGYWTLDDGAGTTATDASGNGNVATLVNAPLWTAGRNGSALAFDGATQYARVSSTAALNAYPLTVGFWMKTGATTGVRGIINKYLDMSLNGWQVYMNAGKLCAWYLKDANNYIDDNSACPMAVAGFNDNQWHQILFVVDASGGKFYVDGMPQAGLPWTGTPGAPTTTQEVQIGHYAGLASGGYFAGVIDDVRIWANAWPNGFPACALEIDSSTVAPASHVIEEDAMPAL